MQVAVQVGQAFHLAVATQKSGEDRMPLAAGIRMSSSSRKCMTLYFFLVGPFKPRFVQQACSRSCRAPLLFAARCLADAV